MARGGKSDIEAGHAANDKRPPSATSSSRANGHANGTNGTADHGSPGRKGPPRRLPASDDPLDDLEDGPLLSDPSRSEKQTFGIEPSGIDQLESVRWQNAAGAEGGLSILGGAFVPEEKRRRCCGVVLCAAAGVLLLCVAALTGIFFIKGLFGQDSREAAEQLDAFAMAPGMEAPALAPFVSDPGMDWMPDGAHGPTAGMTPLAGGARGPTAETTSPAQSAAGEAAAAAAPAAVIAMPGDMGGEPVPEEAWSPLQQLPDQQTADQLQPEVAPGPAAGGGSDLTSGVPSEIPARGDLYFQPHTRWIYQLPKTWTQEDYDQTKLSTDLAYSHMAMLTLLPNGSLASLMQASTVPGEGNAQQALYWQVSDDAGDAWTPPRPVLPPYLSPAGQQLPYWSPVLHMQDGVVYLFYSVSVEVCVFLTRTKYDTARWTPGGNIMMVRSLDGGAFWSQPQTVYTFEDEGGIPKVIANKLAVTATGAWLLPFWRENDRWDAGAGCNAQPGLMGVPAVLVSTNQGESWMVSESVSHGGALPYNWMIENTIAPVTGADGSPGLLQLFRTEAGVPMFQSRSVDGGFHWSIATPSTLPNPNSKVHVVALPNRDLLLAYDDDANLRTPLALAMSRDGGATWHRVVVVEQDHCGQFSYPTIQYVPDSGMVFVAYTVLFLPASMPSDCRAMYGKTATNTTEGLPPSGMRVYVTNEAVLRQQFETALAAAG